MVVSLGRDHGRGLLGLGGRKSSRTAADGSKELVIKRAFYGPITSRGYQY